MQYTKKQIVTTSHSIIKIIINPSIQSNLSCYNKSDVGRDFHPTYTCLLYRSWATKDEEPPYSHLTGGRYSFMCYQISLYSIAILVSTYSTTTYIHIILFQFRSIICDKSSSIPSTAFKILHILNFRFYIIT